MVVLSGGHCQEKSILWQTKCKHCYNYFLLRDVDRSHTLIATKRDLRLHDLKLGMDWTASHLIGPLHFKSGEIGCLQLFVNEKRTWGVYTSKQQHGEHIECVVPLIISKNKHIWSLFLFIPYLAYIPGLHLCTMIWFDTQQTPTDYIQ